jgi:hypothetical protein
VGAHKITDNIPTLVDEVEGLAEIDPVFRERVAGIPKGAHTVMFKALLSLVHDKSEPRTVLHEKATLPPTNAVFHDGFYLSDFETHVVEALGERYGQRIRAHIAGIEA